MHILTNIGSIVGVRPAETASCPLRGHDMDSLPELRDAWLAIDGDRIGAYGSMSDFCLTEADSITDLKGAWLFPAFCDSHTHLVYAGSREAEFVDKINGLSYAEIAARGGGILNSADRLHAATEEQLYEQSLVRVRDIIASGTGAVEIKSGYGLTLPDELKMLRVIARLRSELPIEVRSTFLGAHAVGRAYAGRQDDYVEHVCLDMLPAVAAEGLADFVDVFCEEGFFTPAQTDRILTAAEKFGMRPRLHADQLHSSGGVRVGLAHRAASVDHLENISSQDVTLLAASPDTIATALPGASFFLGMRHTPARELIDAGASLAIASDYNPGSSPSGDMRFMASLGCIQLRLSPEQSINAATINGAAAMGLSRDFGSITPGKVASFFVTRPLPSAAYLLYAYTEPLIYATYLRGRLFA